MHCNTPEIEQTSNVYHSSNVWCLVLGEDWTHNLQLLQPRRQSYNQLNWETTHKIIEVEYKETCQLSALITDPIYLSPSFDTDLDKTWNI